MQSSADCNGLRAVAKTIVNMEQSYVTAAFFRHRTAERYKAMMQAQQTAKLLGEGAHPLILWPHHCNGVRPQL